MDHHHLAAHAASFTHAADEYAAVRPGYPPAAVDLLVPRGARVVLELVTTCTLTPCRFSQQGVDRLNMVLIPSVP